MPFDRLPCANIRPDWFDFPEDRYLSHPSLRVAFIQIRDDPAMVYVASDQKLPETWNEAAEMVAAWRSENAPTTPQ
jgi:hypothetical protein